MYWFKGIICISNCMYMINKKRRYIQMRNDAAVYLQIWFNSVTYRRKYVEYLYTKKIENNNATIIRH